MRNVYKVILLLVFVAALFFALGDLPSVGKSLSAVKTGVPDCAPRVAISDLQGKDYYSGPLIDAHMHMPVSSTIVSVVGKKLGFEDLPLFKGALSPGHIVCLSSRERAQKVFGFFLTTKFSLSQEIATIKKLEKKYPGKIAPFIMPAPYSALRVSIKNIRKTLDKNRGLFKGVGEIKVFDNTSLDSPYFMDLYKLANDYNLVVMMHPFENHREAVEKILSMYPNVKFLLHGNEDGGWLMDVMKKHGNVYYSLDANMTSLYGNDKAHLKKSLSKEEFLTYLGENRESMLNRQLEQWKSRIESYGDRFMWGTDRWYTWHLDQDTSDAIEDFGRLFIGRLSPEIQERFAYKNAEEFLSKSPLKKSSRSVSQPIKSPVPQKIQISATENRRDKPRQLLNTRLANLEREIGVLFADKRLISPDHYTRLSSELDNEIALSGDQKKSGRLRSMLEEINPSTYDPPPPISSNSSSFYSPLSSAQPPCVEGGKLELSADITDFSKIKSITAPGSDSYEGPKGHSFINTDHQRVPIYAPADAIFDSGSYSKDTEGSPAQYLLFFKTKDSCDYQYKFDHIDEPVESIKSALPSTFKTGDSRTTQASKTVEFKAGELLGYTNGTRQAGNWDFGLYDMSKEGVLTSHGSYGMHRYSVCWANWFTPEKREAYRRLLEGPKLVCSF